MRVLVDCRMADWFGVGRYTRSLVRALLRRRDIELALAVPVGSPWRGELPAGIRTMPARLSPLGPGGALELAWLTRMVKPDVVHCTHFPTPLPASRTPLVVTLHDLIPLLEPGAMPSSFRRLVYRLHNWRAAHLASRLIAPSRATADDLEACLPAARGKVRVVHEAADDFSSGAVGPPVGEAGSGRYLLGMASTRSHKELPTLLRAFAGLVPEFPDLALVLVGQGSQAWATSQVPALSRESVCPRVHFTGPADDAQLRALYSGAEVFVFPSRREGFGLPILEAMALGAPVACAATPVAREVGGEAAQYFRTGDAEDLAQTLRMVLGNPEQRSQFVRQGRERAAAFSWEKAAAETVSVYREALADR